MHVGCVWRSAGGEPDPQTTEGQEMPRRVRYTACYRLLCLPQIYAARFLQARHRVKTYVRQGTWYGRNQHVQSTSTQLNIHPGSWHTHHATVLLQALLPPAPLCLSSRRCCWCQPLHCCSRLLAARAGSPAGRRHLRQNDMAANNVPAAAVLVSSACRKHVQCAGTAR
jgi:hypothetical protein